MADQRRAGPIEIKTTGEVQDAKGVFTYNMGRVMREPIVGSDGKIHGYKETAQPGFIEGAVTDRGNLDLVALVTGRDLTVSLGLSNGKMIVLRNAWYAGEGTVSTDESEIPVKWIGDAEEVNP